MTFRKNSKLFILFFIVIGIKQLVWIALIPIWQTPDEQAHFAQVQNIAENNSYEYDNPNFPTTSKEIQISENLLKTQRNSGGNNSYTYHPRFNIEYTGVQDGKYEKQINSQPKENRKKLVAKEATGYPPLYYQFSAVGYFVADNMGLINRVFFLRIWQMVIYLLTVFIYFKSAKSILSDEKQAFLFTAFISFLPMFSFVESGITSDNLMNLLFPCAIYLGILVLKQGINFKKTLLFCLLFFIGASTKPHFAIALPIFVSAILIRQILEKKFLRLVAFFIVALILFAVFYFDRIREFIKSKQIGSLFYETNMLNFKTNSAEMNIFSYFLISLKKTYRETLPWFWGIFRWLSFSLDRWYYRLWNLIALLSVFFSLPKIIKILKNKTRSSKVLRNIIFLVSSVIIYFVVLFYWEYLFFMSHGFSFGIQGRYYFPVLLSIIFLIWYFFPSKNLLFFVSMIANYYTLLKIAFSYYSSTSLSTFTIQASQYKPWYFKSGFLLILICFYLIITIIFLIKLNKWKK